MSVWSLPGALPIGVMQGLLGLFLVLAAASTLANLAGLEPAPAGGWLEGLVGVFAVATLLASLARRLPLQNALACGLILFLTSAMVLAVAVHTRFPLGRLEFTEGVGPRLLGLVAWPVPFLWVALVLSSRQAGKVILRPWRRHRQYGWLLLGCAVLLALLLVAVLDPFGHQVKGWWTWHPRAGAPTWCGAPLALLPTSALLSAGLLLCATVWLIPKRPTGLTPDFEPVVVWLTLDAWLALGCLRSGWVLPAVVGLAGGAAVAWLAWHGKRAPILTPPGAPAGAPVSAG